MRRDNRVWERVRRRYETWSRYYDAVDGAPILSRRGLQRRREAVALLAVKGGDLVLDVGCGTGTMLSLLAKSAPSARLVGLDFAFGMLERARRKVPGCLLVLGDAERMPFIDGSIDRVIAAYTFTSVPDPEACAAEVQRVLRPGGRAVVLDTARPGTLTWRLLTAPTRLVARASGYTYMDRDILPMLRRRFRVVKVIRHAGGFVWTALLERS